MTHSRFHRGFSLTELLVIIGVLAVAGLVVSRLFTSSMRVIDGVPKSHRQLVLFDQMTRAMERDVWGAAAIEIRAGTVVLTQPGGGVIEWMFGQEVTRAAAGAAPQRFNIPNLRPSLDGPALVLTSDAGARTFQSQLMLMEGMQ